MSRRWDSSNPVSLFPFLAVLVSAMGALILLLLAISRQAQRQRDDLHRSVAQSKARDMLPPLPKRLQFSMPEALSPSPEVPLADPVLPPLPEVVDLRPTLQSQRDDMLRRLANVQVNQPASDASAPLDDFERARAKLAADLDSIDRERRHWTEKLLPRRQEIDEWNVRLRRAERGDGAAHNRYAIVPYSGPGGTRRRPIFLECRRLEIVLQPEQVAIPADWLQDPENANNPLAAMVRAVIDRIHASGDAEMPYPLLIVRPDSVAAYYVAQKAIDHIGVPFGYELVDENVVLEYAASDPELRRVADDAIRRAIERRATGYVASRANVRRPTESDAAGAPADVGGAIGSLGGIYNTDARGANSAAAGSQFELRPVPTVSDEPSNMLESRASPSVSSNAADKPLLTDADTTSIGRRRQEATSGGPRRLLSTTFDELLFPGAASREGHVSEAEPPWSAAEGSDGTRDAGPTGAGPFLPVPALRVGTVRREIAVVCRLDRLVLYPGEVVIPIAHSGSIRSAATQVYEHAQKFAAMWNARRSSPPTQCHLEFYVLPDGLGIFYQMRMELLGSHLPVSHRLAEDDRWIATRR